MKRRRASLGFLVVYVATLLFGALAYLGQPLQIHAAISGPTQLESNLSFIKNDCSTVQNGDSNWNKCQAHQNALKAVAGCSGTMFNDVTATRNNPNPTTLNQNDYKDCQTKIKDYSTVWQNAQKILDTLKSDCQTIGNTTDLWNTCQDPLDSYQNSLDNSVGCGHMFAKSNTVPAGRDGTIYNLQQSSVDDCQSYIVTIVQAAASEQCKADKYSGSELTACIAGYVGQAGGNSQDTSCSKYTGKDLAACQKGFGDSQTAGTTNPSPGGSSEDYQVKCASSALGLSYIICESIKLITSIINGLIHDVILPNLQVDPLDQTCTNSCYGAQLYTAWSHIRDLASVLLALVLLVVVFANALSISLDAYTVKKMIPRLVAAAILMQFSFVLAAAAIDIGNILGSGLETLIGSLQVTNGSTHALQFGFGDSVAVLGGSIAALAIVGAPTILLTLLGGFFTAIGVIFTLIARKLIIAVLILLGPLAFAAWVLPGTEQYFKKWYTLLIRIILMYPLIILIFEAAKVGQGIVGGK